MPLMKGSSRKTIRKNVSTLLTEGYKRDQAIAIAMRKAGKGKNNGKKSSKKSVY